MAGAVDSSGPGDRLRRLRGYLEQDPDNLALIAEAAETAYEARAFDEAAQLLAAHADRAPLPPPLLNLRGMAALAQGRAGDAAADFAALLEADPQSAALRFNLAWAQAKAGDAEGALAVLDEPSMALPGAARLKVQLLHQLERVEEALEAGAGLALIHPDDEGLFGALATAAIDADRPDLARAYAARAGGDPDGRTSAGLLMLEAGRATEAVALFDAVLAGGSEHPRALLGKGSALLAGGDAAAAAALLDRAAERFGDHLGSWVAAGWAHYVAGAPGEARRRFETALALDDSFAETHGALAVLDATEGRTDSARRRCEVALRLDRACFSAALAQSLLLEADGDPERAQKLRDKALSQPVGAGKRTLAEAMAGFAAGRR